MSYRDLDVSRDADTKVLAQRIRCAVEIACESHNRKNIARIREMMVYGNPKETGPGLGVVSGEQRSETRVRREAPYALRPGIGGTRCYAPG